MGSVIATPLLRRMPTDAKLQASTKVLGWNLRNNTPTVAGTFAIQNIASVSPAPTRRLRTGLRANDAARDTSLEGTCRVRTLTTKKSLETSASMVTPMLMGAFCITTASGIARVATLILAIIQHRNKCAATER